MDERRTPRAGRAGGIAHVVSSLLLAVATLAFARPSSASEGEMHLKVDWGSLARSIAGLESQDVGHARIVETDAARWLSWERIDVQLVARNWEGAQRLVGGPMPVTDAIRVSRSSRMIVGRIGLTGGRVVPFVHVGVGQWRDPDPHILVPSLDYAAQTGVGLEIRQVAPSWAFAVEYDWTMAYRDARPSTPERRLGWGEAFAVLRWNFEATASRQGQLAQ